MQLVLNLPLRKYKLPVFFKSYPCAIDYFYLKFTFIPSSLFIILLLLLLLLLLHIDSNTFPWLFLPLTLVSPDNVGSGAFWYNGHFHFLCRFDLATSEPSSKAETETLSGWAWTENSASPLWLITPDSG